MNLEDRREQRILELRGQGWGYGTIANIVNREFPELRELDAGQVRHIINKNKKANRRNK